MELIYPGLGLIFWMTLSFALLFLILKKFAWKPILSMLQDREKQIDDALNAAERAREDMKQLQSDNEKLLRDAKIEREQILSEGRQLKDKILDEARTRGNLEAQRMIEAAREAIKFEKMAAITELKNQVALLSIDIAEKVLKEELNVSAKQKQLINNLLDEINFN
jgi:F-type H+-transporting ATPase subunit b